MERGTLVFSVLTDGVHSDNYDQVTPYLDAVLTPRNPRVHVIF